MAIEGEQLTLDCFSLSNDYKIAGKRHLIVVNLWMPSRWSYEPSSKMSSNNLCCSFEIERLE